MTRKEEILMRINEREALYKTKADENALGHETLTTKQRKRRKAKSCCTYVR